ncbi:hypothetical protein FRX31_021543 [Thalictrum thalictroides]|uniref:Defensin-like protein n=1 Tax=Thalictrum thalictroides TaxID=46969 RepID=A0A7J6VX29_THATH|nr:hypothetical protein FRX31_021543 [Thalictrum thalictroides]
MEFQFSKCFYLSILLICLLVCAPTSDGARVKPDKDKCYGMCYLPESCNGSCKADGFEKGVCNLKDDICCCYVN